jgi:hypothetical protein
MVSIEAGLSENDEVLLYEPKPLPEIPWAEEKKPTPTATDISSKDAPLTPPHLRPNGSPEAAPDPGRNTEKSNPDHPRGNKDKRQKTGDAANGDKPAEKLPAAAETSASAAGVAARPEASR